MCSLRDAAEGFEALGVTVYGVSLDDVATLRRFAETQELNFQLLSDADGSVATKYGVLMAGRGMSKRVTFVIDPKGVLQHIDDGVKVDSHGADLLALVRELQGG